MGATTGFRLSRLSETGAAEIVGLDCAQPFDGETLDAVTHAFTAYPILVFRDQRLSPREQASFSRQFGSLEEQINREHVDPAEPDVLILSNEIRPDGTAVGIVDAGDFLHSDSSWSPTPCKATILYSVRNPKSGGDTEYCNMYLVYEALPDRLRDEIKGRRAVHHVSKLKNKRVAVSRTRPGAAQFYGEQSRAMPEVAQPMVRTHPESGRSALYVSPRFTLRVEGMEEAASDRLLDELFAFMGEERFRYRHRWSDHDLVMWDNRCLTHRACGGYVLPDIRRMHRTTICGDPPF
jgi:taurine dioxygenase